VRFEADAGESWDLAEKTVVETAALNVGSSLAQLHNRDQWLFCKTGDIDEYTHLTARRAFLLVYEGPVTFVRKSFECEEGCFGRTITTREIWVYQNAVVNDVRFIVHELGHAFEDALEEIVGDKPPRNRLDEIQRENPDFPNRIDNAVPDDDDPNFGFAGPFPGWQQSRDESAGEEFADMYIGWTYNTWASNLAGWKRANFMSSYMPLWVEMAQNH
jgi:hypothetical protein